jgi:hypothetical protein
MLRTLSEILCYVFSFTEIKTCFRVSTGLVVSGPHVDLLVPARGEPATFHGQDDREVDPDSSGQCPEPAGIWVTPPALTQ